MQDLTFINEHCGTSFVYMGVLNGMDLVDSKLCTWATLMRPIFTINWVVGLIIAMYSLIQSVVCHWKQVKELSRMPSGIAIPEKPLFLYILISTCGS